MAEEKRFGNVWEKYELIKLGGFWAIAIGTITDRMGIKKIRIAKGKVKGKVFKDDKGNLQYEFDDKNDPITQVNRLNIKTAGEWEKIKKLVDKRIKEFK